MCLKDMFKSLTVKSGFVWIVAILIDYYTKEYGAAEIYKQVHQIVVPVVAASSFTFVIGLRRAVGVKDNGVKPPPLNTDIVEY